MSKGGIFSCNKDTLENNALLLQNAGFLQHENCIPYLAKTKGGHTSKADAELRKVEVLDVNLLPRTKVKKEVELKKQLEIHAKEIEEHREPLLRKLKQDNEETERIKMCKENFRKLSTIPLPDLKQGSNTINAAKKVETRFGISYKLLIEEGKSVYTAWTNKYLTNIFTELEEGNRVYKDGGFLSLNNKALGILDITGKGTNVYGKVSVYATFTLNSCNTAKELSSLTDSSKVDSIPVTEIPTIARENLLPYRDYENLISFPIGSLHQIDAIGYITHYGTPRLVLQIRGTIYQAGQDLEEKKDTITLGCSIKIEKIRKNKTRHVKYAICSIYEKGDWTAMTDYTKTPMLSKFDGSTCIVDVRTVDVKGTKRKLLLTNIGDVYKLKKSKLEETIKPGFI